MEDIVNIASTKLAVGEKAEENSEHSVTENVIINGDETIFKGFSLDWILKESVRDFRKWFDPRAPIIFAKNDRNLVNL